MAALAREPDEVLAGYVAELERLPLAPATRRTYRSRVADFLAWLAGAEVEGGDPLAEPFARDYAVRDYKAHLKSARRAKPSSVNLSLAALDSFYCHLNLGPAVVRREELPGAAPRALDPAEQRRFSRAVEREASARDRAIALLLLHTGLRIGELVALDVADVALSARKGLVTVRSGKGDRYREVPLNAEVRPALQTWRDERAQLGPPASALFTSRGGARLTTRSVDLIVRRLAAEAGVSASAHTLRHTCLTRLVRAGNDVVLVAELAGHRRLETTRRYSLPSAADRQAAMEGLVAEY